ncbi:MAG TPA: biotin--[acetyl-CoA-carboxylase] ligase [Bacteroidetes bacterium]|nr:biotin--[acetyl-CoA-carboxylase] ligase [Bacteroidota bacterium]
MRRLVHFISLHSTNTYTKQWASKSTPIYSTAILADYQREGRGRGGNLWTADAGKNLTVSFTHPKLRIRDMEALRVHFLFALNLFRALKTLDLNLSIKWPNDLMLGDKKIAGILSEVQHDKTGDALLIIGLGLNINQEDFGSLNEKATSIHQALPHTLKVQQALEIAWQAFEKTVEEASDFPLASICEKINNHLYAKGKQASIRQGEDKTEGELLGLHHDGRITLRKSDGSVHYLAAGNLFVSSS